MGKTLTAAEIREKFLKFFETSGHKRVASSSLVPRMDPTLLFTNAGMNQFKSVFTGEEKRDYKRATSSQKCVRAGGKHNDLENVGRTSRHHTFFEMLGNFSFGDYFKKEAIAFAWEFVTKELKLSKDRLYVSVYKDDEEAAGIWKDDIGIDEKRIFRFGDKDNFWAMGETGPCGPCSEIFFDQGPGVGCEKSTCTVGCECDRYIEFWNLVFMEFDQRDGKRTKLPKPSIDTGMGLERVTAIVQGVTSNYDSDLFGTLLREIAKRAGSDYAKAADEAKISMRVIADHLRAMTFLISDGIQPSNEGRGYVLRRIMRRAMRHGRRLGIQDIFLNKLVSVVIGEMGDAYPELKERAASIEMWVKAEEEAFARTIDRGLELLQEQIDRMKSQKESRLGGETAFRLYDTFGFPVDMTADILRDVGFTLDQEGFDEAVVAHREKARGSWKGSAQKAIDALAKDWIGEGIQTEFLGYTALAGEGKILKIVSNGKVTGSAKTGEEIEFVTDRTPFYGESGGQVGDIGAAAGEGCSLEIIDTQKPVAGIHLHRARVTEGEIREGVSLTLRVDDKARLATAKNHTATHMLHATLKEVLGSHVQQKGSLVAPERLRFDFAHPKALTASELSTIEQKMNERIWADSQVEKEVLPFDQAIKTGAVALFDEKYGSTVRVITVAEYSKELCGGTHLDRTGEIGIFKIVKESSVSAGVRRMEAFTSQRAFRYLQEMENRVKEIGSALGSTTDEIPGRIEKLLQRQKELEKELKAARSGAATSSSEMKEDSSADGTKIVSVELENADHKELREAADRHLERIQSGVVVLGSLRDGKAFIVVKVSKDLLKKFDAGRLVQVGAKILDGSGGGRADMAQAGGTAVDKLPDAITAIVLSMK